MDILYPSGKVFFLFKFGKKEHIEDFVFNGNLYMNTLKCFREYEISDHLRADKNEGVSHCAQANGATLLMKDDGGWKELGTNNSPLLSTDGNEEDINVFCMYALRESANKSLVNNRNLNFGDTYAAFTNANAQEFLKRVKTKAKEENLKLEFSLVEYVDINTYSGKMGVFKKFSKFVYQSEFRISIITSSKQPYSLTIGDLSDISKIGKLANINNHINFE